MENNNTLEFHIYVSENASGFLYLDNGKLDPIVTTYKISISNNNGKYLLKWVRKGNYMERYKMWKFVFHGVHIHKVRIGEKKVNITNNEFTVKEIFSKAEIT